MKGNIRLLAKEAKCSPATVSRVLNDFPYVKPELRERVIAAAKKYHYTLSRNCYLVIIPASAYFLGYLGHILQKLFREAEARNYHLTITTEKDVKFTNGTYLFDGVIAVPSQKGLEGRWGQNEALPMVCFNSQGKADDNILRVSSDNRQGIFMALDHFKKYGHRKIAFVTPDNRPAKDTTDISERQSYYLEWMEQHNKGVDPVICTIPLNEEGSGGDQQLRDLIRKGVTAFLVPGEGCSPYIYSKLQQMDLKIPRDISIIGMEHHMLSFAFSPPETTIEQDWDLLVSAAFDTLEKIRNNLTAQDISIPYRLIERESVADLNHSAT